MNTAVINPHNKRGYKQGYYTPRNPQKYIGIVDSRGIPYRSSLEYKFMVMIDNNSDVIRWAYEHPKIVINYYDPVKKKHRNYYPDYYMECMVHGKLRTFLIEVKPEHETRLPNRNNYSNDKSYIRQLSINAVVEAKRRATIEYCKKTGWTYMFVTENFFKQ